MASRLMLFMITRDGLAIMIFSVMNSSSSSLDNSLIAAGSRVIKQIIRTVKEIL